MINDKCSGFTLIEILVVMAIVGMIAVIASGVMVDRENPKNFENTRQIMKEIKKAVLGVRGFYKNGQRQFTGFVSHLGALPPLDENGQPKALWTDDLNSDGSSDLPPWEYNEEFRISMGWRGPYLDCHGEILKDGWGRHLVFERFDINDEGKEVYNPDGGNMRIKSPGANGIFSHDDKGYDEDIELVIYYNEYMGQVAGLMDENINGKICFPAYNEAGADLAKTSDLTKTFRDAPCRHFFCFEKKDNADIPIGVRSIKVTGGSRDIYLFAVEPTINWVGTLE